MKNVRRTICLLILAAILLIPVTGCRSDIHQSGGDIEFLTSSAFTSSRPKGVVIDEFRGQYSDFALRLLRECDEGNNTLISPLSVLTALLMTANGAKGETLDEMMRVIGGELGLEPMNQQLYNYYESLGNSANAKFHVANAVWFTDDPNFTVNGDFVKTIENTFRAQLAKVPFTDKATVNAINKWCSDNTDKMIPRLIENEDVDGSTVMLLANALCFDALWMEQYEDHQVSERTFHGENDDNKVKMMYSEESCYIEGPSETGFIKPYRGGYSFVALLPKSGVSMDDYLSSLTGERFTVLMDGRSNKFQVNAGLPEFSFDWNDTLVNALKDLGIEAAFDGDRADFSGLGDIEVEGGLYISNVIHKTHIEVDQSGTRAAAVTSVIMLTESEHFFEETKDVILDKPFVYAIVDTTSMLPIFIGTVREI